MDGGGSATDGCQGGLAEIGPGAGMRNASEPSCDLAT